MITRILETTIKKRLFSGKAIIILGPRQSGKTTVIKAIRKKIKRKILSFTGDDPATRQLLDTPSLVKLKQIIGKNKVLIIDEAQRIENIGLSLKLIIDNIEGVQIIVTGSSAFELTNYLNEPLTGRKWEYRLYPLSFQELAAHNGVFDEFQNLENRLIFGSYPEVVTSIGEEIAVLKQITDSYLFKDVLILDNIKKSNKLEKLLQALALQIGQQVSYNELSNLLDINRATIERYIDILEKAFVIFRLSPLSRNMRNELKRSRKIFFADTGVRNAVINNFGILSLRQDTGALWENYLISERIKRNAYANVYANYYFWRTHSQQEIDFIEERNGKLYAFEFKWNGKRKVKVPNSFIKAYPDAEFKVITPDNYIDFLND